MRAFLVALVGTVGAGLLAPYAAAPDPAPPAQEPLIQTLDRPRGGDVLLKLDPVSLAPTSAPLRTFREVSGFAFSPDRRRLALGGGFMARGKVQLVDVQRWTARVVELGGRAPVSVIRWLAPERLLVSLGESRGRHIVGVVDPARGVILRRRTYPGLGTAWASGDFGVVTVVSPPRQVRPVRLLHIDPQGNLRSTQLARIEAGIRQRRRGRIRLQRIRAPGLAVDPERGIAYVVAAGPPLVAEIALTSGQVSYHRLTQVRASRGAGRARAAKGGGGFEEWTRHARWLGDGALAVTGEYRRALPRRAPGASSRLGRLRSDSFRYKPFGARLIDTGKWTISLLDRRPTSIASAQDRLLATGRHGPSWDHAGRRDAGLLAFDANGRRVFERFRGEDVTVVGVHAGRAYAWVRRTRMLHTVELASGRRVHARRVLPSRLPPLLVPEGFGGGP